jgi:hypothetical protein
MRLVSYALFCTRHVDERFRAAGGDGRPLRQPGGLRRGQSRLQRHGPPDLASAIRRKQARIGRHALDPDPDVGGDGKLTQNCSFEAGATLAQVDLTLHDPKMNHEIGQYAVSSATIDSAKFAADLKLCSGDFEQRKDACYVVKPEGGTVEAGQMIEIVFGNRK